eukprot:769100-Amphidinium_carterae.2
MLHHRHSLLSYSRGTGLCSAGALLQYSPSAKTLPRAGISLFLDEAAQGLSLCQVVPLEQCVRFRARNTRAKILIGNAIHRFLKSWSEQHQCGVHGSCRGRPSAWASATNPALPEATYSCARTPGWVSARWVLWLQMAAARPSMQAPMASQEVKVPVH